MRTLGSLLVMLGLAAGTATSGCVADGEPEEAVAKDDAALLHRTDDQWFYNGPLQPLLRPQVTVSLSGHTARVRGFVADASAIGNLPHTYVVDVPGGEKRVDVVYPIATGQSVRAPAGVHPLERAFLYYTEVDHWGGFPYVEYFGNIAFHGPITEETNKQGQLVWYLERGPVSHGCNRMNGEHVTELAHILGMNMRKVHGENHEYHPGDGTMPKGISVKVIDGLDEIDVGGVSKIVDVDYPTQGFARPTGNVKRFGSWIASEIASRADLPDTKVGAGGAPYVFADHVRKNWVCSMPKDVIGRLHDLASIYPGDRLPGSLCAKRGCVTAALRNGKDARPCFAP